MLSDHDRETLRDIQRQLRVDDPDFERSFRALGALSAQPPAPPSTRSATSTPKSPSTASGGYRWVYTVIIVVAALLAVVLLLVGSFGGALAFTIVAGSVWLGRHIEHGGRHRKRDD